MNISIIKNLKINKEKIIALALAGTMSLSMTACGKKTEKFDPNDTMTYPVTTGWIENSEPEASQVTFAIDEENEVIEPEVTPEVTPEPELVQEKYDFACLTEDTIMTDEWGNYITDIDAYQKVMIIQNYGTWSTVEYRPDNDQSILTGFVRTELLEVLPETYIEIDISSQTIRMFIDGEEQDLDGCESLGSYTVTGKAGVSPTRIGLHEIYYKEEGATLKSYRDDGSLEYASYVDYWMPFDRGIGLHDAEYHTDSNGNSHGWRHISEFGGDTYIYNGSHGCVNLMNETAKFIYNNSEVGTKVLVHK